MPPPKYHQENAMSCYHCPDIRIARKETGLVTDLLRDIINVTQHIETQVTIDEDLPATDFADQRELLNVAIQYTREAEDRLQSVRETLILRQQRLEKEVNAAPAPVPPLSTVPPRRGGMLDNIQHTVVGSER